MSVLDQIKTRKRLEVAERKQLHPTALLEKSLYFSTTPISLKRYLAREDLSGVIAEIKRRSPSKGWINRHISIEHLSIGYMLAGASALSVLTDKEGFGGTNEDLTTARKFNLCPILRKDFVIDEYQIVEARSIGADVVLLIAALLTPAEISKLAAGARSLGLETLLEVHTKEELLSYPLDEIDLIGVNSRDLSDFSVDLRRAFELREFIPQGKTSVAESGITCASDIQQLQAAGYNGFLIGELFMSSSHPEKQCQKIISEYRRLKTGHREALRD